MNNTQACTIITSKNRCDDDLQYYVMLIIMISCISNKFNNKYCLCYITYGRRREIITKIKREAMGNITIVPAAIFNNLFCILNYEMLLMTS